MRENLSIPLEAYHTRRRQLQFLQREKQLALNGRDLPKASVELRAILPIERELKDELSVLCRVLAKNGILPSTDEKRSASEPEVRYASSVDAMPLAGAGTADDILNLRGYAVLWGDLSADLGGFYEKFERGAFSESLADETDKFFLLEHVAPPLASTAEGNLLLEETDDGLRFHAQLDRRESIVQRREQQLRQLKNMSFGFLKVRDRWTEERGGKVIRTVLTARLLEISAVRSPAYKATTLAVANRSNYEALAQSRARSFQLQRLEQKVGRTP